jgi:alpha-glucosidase
MTSYFRSLAILALGLSLFAGCGLRKQTIATVTSPDGELSIVVHLDESGAPFYHANYKGKVIMNNSRMGFMLDSIPSLDTDFIITRSEVTSADTTWEQPWGEERFIRDNHNELKVSLKQKGTGRTMNVYFRAFDYGFGFRYEFPVQLGLEKFRIMDELTEFALTDNHKAWWIPAYKGNQYEFLPALSPVDELEYVNTPVTIETKDSLFISIHEAALVDFSSMVLQGKGNHVLKADLAPWKNGVRTYVTENNRRTPWRTVQIAEKPGDLITSYLILNLNEPNVLKDVSWIKPGKYVGVWWEMHLNTGTWHQGPKHSANTANTKRYIDFAAEHGFDGVLVEGWNVGWDGDWTNGRSKFIFTKPYPDYDLSYLAAYARERGVYLIGHHETGADIANYEQQLEDAYAYLEKNGMKAVKTGYVGEPLANGEWHHGQYSVRHHQKVCEVAARHRVMLLAHEPIKDTGLRRTYPNFVSREAARGQEYNAWSGDGGNPPDYLTILPFTRMLAGPMDYTPGTFEMLLPTQPNNQINGTLAKELAIYVVIYAPMQMACDLPEHYSNQPAFQFIKDVPTDWETTRVLDAQIGNYVSIARKQRNSDDWYVGAVTDENARELQINLDFLDEGAVYEATLYKDTETTDYKTNPTAIGIETMHVRSTSVLSIPLAPSGGVAISIKKKK